MRRLSRGELPALARVAVRGAIQDLRFDPPAVESAWWVSVATGLLSIHHKVWRDFALNEEGAAWIGRPDWSTDATPFWERLPGYEAGIIGWPGTRGGAGTVAFACDEENAPAEARVRPEQIDEGVLTALVPGWPEHLSAEVVALLRQLLARLYTQHRAARLWIAPGRLLVGHWDFLSSVQRHFGHVSGLDLSGKAKTLLSALPDRAVALQDLLLGDLLDTAGATAQVIVAGAPDGNRPAPPWESRTGFAAATSEMAPEGTEWTFSSLISRLRLAPADPKRIPPIQPVAAPLSALHERGMPVSFLATAWLSQEAQFNSGLAHLAAGDVPAAEALLSKAWHAAPEHQAHAAALAHARQRQRLTHAQASLQVLLDHGPLPPWLKDFDVHPVTPDFRFVVADPSLAPRLLALAGIPSFETPVTLFALTVLGEAERIVGGAATTLPAGEELEVARLFLMSRWRRCPEAIEMMAHALDREAAVQGRLGWWAEVLQCHELAESLQSHGFAMERVDEIWRVSFAKLLGRVAAAWHSLRKRRQLDCEILAGEPPPNLWPQVLALAQAHGLDHPRLRAELRSPAAAAQAFFFPLCEWLFVHGELAAVVLARRISHSRAFIPLRVVAPRYAAHSGWLNVRAMLGPLQRGLDHGLEDLEFAARRGHEDESIAMGRRSEGQYVYRRFLLRRIR